MALARALVAGVPWKRSLLSMARASSRSPGSAAAILLKTSIAVAWRAVGKTTKKTGSSPLAGTILQVELDIAAAPRSSVTPDHERF